MINLMPMAGRGSRFIEQKYNVAKPFVIVLDEPMVISALRSFPICDKYIFIARSEHAQKLDKVLSTLKTNHEIIVVDKVTDGQACTCLLAEKLIDQNEPVFIASCDYQMVYDEAKYQKMLENKNIDVIIWTFKIGSIKKANPEAFAYCRVDGDNVVEVVEKKTISDDPYNDHAVVGSFTYKTFKLFRDGANSMIEKNIRVNNEFYVGTSINQLIEKGFKVKVFEIDKFISFGHPFELETYHYWQEYFDRAVYHPYSIDYGYAPKR